MDVEHAYRWPRWSPLRSSDPTTEDGLDGHLEESDSSTMESLDYEVIENLAYREEQVNNTPKFCIVFYRSCIWTQFLLIPHIVRIM